MLKEHYVDIKYKQFDYKVTMRTHSAIEFKDGAIYFTASGRGYAIPFNKVISITPIEEED